MDNNIFVNRDLYLGGTDALLTDVLGGGLSLTSTFAINIKDVDPLAQEISFLAYEATLPGSSFQVGELFGDRQGISETYAIKRVFPPVDVSFYIKSDYGSIKYFENWMRKVSTLDDDLLSPRSSYKFNYPNTYKKAVNIVKYEKNFRSKENRLKKGGPTVDPSTITYSLLEAYPVNIIAIPVSYDQPSILRTTITFNYTRYAYQTNYKRN